MMANFSANCKTKHLTWKWLRNFLYKWIKNYDCVSKVIILNQNWWVHFDIPYALLYAYAAYVWCVFVCVCGWLDGKSELHYCRTHTTHTHSQSKRSTYIQFTAVMNLSHRILLPLSPFWFFFSLNKNTKKTKKKIHRPTASHEHRAQHKAHNQDAESNIIVSSCLKLPFASMWIMCAIENNVCARGMRVPLCTHI